MFGYSRCLDGETLNSLDSSREQKHELSLVIKGIFYDLSQKEEDEEEERQGSLKNSFLVYDMTPDVEAYLNRPTGIRVLKIEGLKL